MKRRQWRIAVPCQVRRASARRTLPLGHLNYAADLGTNQSFEKVLFFSKHDDRFYTNLWQKVMHGFHTTSPLYLRRSRWQEGRGGELSLSSHYRECVQMTLRGALSKSPLR